MDLQLAERNVLSFSNHSHADYRQRFQLDEAVKTLAVIRVTAVGPGKRVALSELEIR